MPDDERDKVFIVIPAYNEAPRIEDVVTRVKPMTQEVIVVDDGSEDNTAELARRAGATVFRTPSNHGLGHATRIGILLAYNKGADYVLTMDADGQHLPEEAPILLSARSKVDIVFGCRDTQRMPFLRRVLNSGTKLIVRLITGMEVNDPLCGFRVYSRNAIEQLELRHDGHPFIPGVAINALLLRLPTLEVKVSTVYVDKSPTYHLLDFFRAFGVYLHFLNMRLKFMLG